MKTADNSGQPPPRDGGGKEDLVAPQAGAVPPIEPEEPRTNNCLGGGKEGGTVSLTSQSSLTHHDDKSLAVRDSTRDFTARKRAEEALLESDGSLFAILENSPALMFLKDLTGRYIYVNRRFEAEFGLTREAILGRTDLAIFPPEQAEAFRANDAAVLQAGVPCQFEEIARYTDGEHASIVSKFPLLDAQGRVSALCGIAVDITERKRAQTKLQDNEERLRQMFESVQDYAIFWLDPTGHVASWNTGAKRIKGYDTAEILGQHFSVFYPKEDIVAGMPEKVLAEALAAGHCEKEGWRIRKDGSRFWGHIAISAVRDARGCLRGYVKVTRDMTEKRQAEEAVSQARERLTQLSHQLLAAQELERRRIARELHDQLGQSLVLLQINLQKIQESPKAKDVAHAVGESITMVERLHEQARNLSLDLRPSLLDDLGLVPALRWHLDRLAQSSGLSVHFAAGASVGRYPAEIETTCFRIAQEALANVSRHAQAKHVSVNLAQDTAGLSLRITDDGIGFEVAAARRQATRGRSMGLLSMEERMNLAGGELLMDSQPAKGSTICARFPLAAIAALSTNAPIGDSYI